MPFLPAFNPDNFTPGERVDNRYFTLTPGTIQSYFGSVVDPDTGEEHTEANDFFVTYLTTDIAGVQVIVVRDTAYDDGVLVEDTIDWFAQDEAGNVWYLGEIVNNYIYNEHNGNFVETNHNGAWEAGVDGALPGWIMEAVSQIAIGDSYFQEFAPGIAVDEALVTARGLTISADDVTYNRVLQIREFSALEPDVFGFKYYAPGVGVVRVEEFDANGNLEFTSELIGTRNLGRTDQRGLDTPEQNDFDGETIHLQITGADTDAVNALGAYTFDLETGEIGEAWIILAEIDPADLGSVSLELEEGQGLGLFLVPNADELGLNISHFKNGGLFFVNMLTGEAATLGDGMAPMIVDENGQPLPIQAFHALGSGNGFNLLNPGAGINVTEGQSGGVDVLQFEDTRVTDPDFDGDFDDLIIAIGAQPFESVGPFLDKAAGGWRYDGADLGVYSGDEPADFPNAWTQADWSQAGPTPDTGLWA